MLSVVLSATTITMNRGEQETLFRQSRNLRLLTEAKAQHQRQLLEIKQHQMLQRHSYGNIHQLSVSSHMQGTNSGQVPCDDLVLSVLKSPLRDQSISVGGGGVISGSVGDIACSSTNGHHSHSHSSIPTPSPHGEFCNLPNSEDELVDDIESALETTNLDSSANNKNSTSPGALKFLRRFRTNRTPRFEAHHRRVPTPAKRKGRSRSKSRADILDGVAHSTEATGKSFLHQGGKGVPSSKYIFLIKIQNKL